MVEQRAKIRVLLKVKVQEMKMGELQGLMGSLSNSGMLRLIIVKTPLGGSLVSKK